MAKGFAQSFKVAIGAVDTVQQEDLGVVRYTDNAVYKYVKFSGTTTIAVGDALCYVITDLNLQTVDKANSAVGAGIATVAVTSGTVQYGWIQIGGIATLSTTTGGAVGNSLSNIGASAGAIIPIAAHTSPQVGVLVNASAPILVQLDYLN